MADKYFIFGAAFNGDGTTSAEAASAGAAGAWNQATILTGTLPSFGTLLAGDVVYIRSRTGNGANANISNTLGASITFGAGAAVATVAAPITWILDNGVKWAGISGTLTYTTSSTSFGVSQRAFNRLIANSAGNWIFEFTAASPPAAALGLVADTDGIKVSQPNRAGGGANGVITGTVASTHQNFSLSVRQVSSVSSAAMLVASACSLRWVNPTIEVSLTGVSGGLFGHVSGYGVNIVYGGRVTGAGATTGQSLCAVSSATSANHVFEAIGLQVPKAMSLSATPPAAGTRFSLFGLDGGSGGAIASAGGSADSRNIDNFYPTLNATLADSASSPVSWRMYPQGATSNEYATLPICKLYTSAAATKTVTLEFLLANPWGGGAANAKSIWMTVSYIDDTTGLPVSRTTRDEGGAALTTSTAAWSATSWGAVGFVKLKLVVTTPTAIKQDTAVTVTFSCAAASASANDLLMICPDVQLT